MQAPSRDRLVLAASSGTLVKPRRRGRGAPWRRIAAAVAAGALAASAHASPDASRGADVFDVHCAECHSLVPGKHRKGPSLFGVLGRRAGAMPHYEYSAAMRDSGLVWSADQIARYVSAPRAVVPGGKMKYDGAIGTRELEDLLAFLANTR